MARKTLVVGEREDGTEIEVPAVWEICDTCRGDGSHSRRVEPDGGFTSSEWAEACADDDEFADRYFSGGYDSPCEDCDSAGKVQVTDYDALSVEDRAEVEAYEREEAVARQNDAYVRRMGF